jgi:hypothetical protein
LQQHSQEEIHSLSNSTEQLKANTIKEADDSGSSHKMNIKHEFKMTHCDRKKGNAAC